MLENEHLVYTRRSFSQNRLFRFWHDFSSENESKLASKFDQKNDAIFNRKIDDFGTENGAKTDPK